MKFRNYQGFRYRLREIFESTDDRLAANRWQSKVIGWTIEIQMPIKNGAFTRMKGESEEYESEEAAISEAEGYIDAITDSL